MKRNERPLRICFACYSEMEFLISLPNALHGCTPATQSVDTPIAIKHDGLYLDGANKVSPFNVGTYMEGETK